MTEAEIYQYFTEKFSIFNDLSDAFVVWDQFRENGGSPLEVENRRFMTKPKIEGWVERRVDRLYVPYWNVDLKNGTTYRIYDHTESTEYIFKTMAV